MSDTETGFAALPHFLTPKTVGVNLDPIDVAAGLQQANSIGYGDGESQMVLHYALQRWARGEEEAAERMVVKAYKTDLTSWRMILAAAMAVGQASLDMAPSRGSL
jgi:hypothetical protein